MNNKKDKIAIFGCGFEGNLLQYNLMNDGVGVDYYVDNYRTDSFWGNEVKRLEEIIDIDNVFFYISSHKYYDQIKQQLIDYGLVEFDDFINGMSYNKKIVMINANCYGPAISTFLRSNEIFSKHYFIYDSTPIFEKKIENAELLPGYCDVYIGQDIREDNPFGEVFSDSFISERLKSGCRRIIIPNLVGMGKMFFPQSYREHGKANDDPALKYGFFPQGDRIVDDLYKSGLSLNEILYKIESGSSFSKDEIEANFIDAVNKFREREQYWDVKIIDYILENYRNFPMFYDLFHPTNAVYKKICEGILILLGIDNKEMKDAWPQNSFELFVYPEVAKHLKLKYWSPQMDLRVDSKYILSSNKRMNFKQWVKEYIIWYYERNHT